MGGISGLIYTTLPILVLMPINNAYGLGAALAASLGVAALIFLWRLIRKESLQPAISGLVGVGIGAGIAWWTGDAKGYFLYGIWMSLLFAVVAVISVAVRWPLVGVIWKGINGQNMKWREDTRARRAYGWATLGWALVFIARFLVQNNFYNSDATTALWLARLLMGWPLTGLVTLFTIFMVRRAGKLIEQGEQEKTGDEHDPAPAAESNPDDAPDTPGTINLVSGNTAADTEARDRGTRGHEQESNTP
ncbi:DUF3159 domain-containing protein [Corynebacterium sp. A21]|uniref:DUF3159 domain-containing protein n=1 Tax=Corynebacterium sp. A21 TaxID=3457318 RepID=UPI003FD2C15B